jgi:leucyl/phenylalanyl-tRNA---protein transferase
MNAARGQTTRFFCLANRTWSNTLPSPRLALDDPNGLLAVGGALTTHTLIQAYSAGIFPWYSFGQPILWWSPSPRAVLEPTEFHASRSLLRSLRRYAWQVTVDTDFAGVLQACAAPRRDQSGTWLTPEMQTAYLELHRTGYAHSLECWQDDALIGGIYGVALGQVFFGESMFSRVSDGSKVALYALCRRLQHWGYRILDCQVPNPHLVSLGMSLLTRDQFCALVREASAAPVVDDAWMQVRHPEPP